MSERDSAVIGSVHHWVHRIRPGIGADLHVDPLYRQLRYGV